ncbi:glycosyltransferase family 4 protein [Metabacillus fastidiosus]|uniref:glycosyltransferase family 4 protein n=1 Tax=Metabacillus fastidiosus TaxID=1458 RepID=UPI003D2B43A0
MNVLLLTDKLITGGAENYFCKLENELQHPDLTFYTAAGPGELFSKIKNENKFIPMMRKNHLGNVLKIRKVVIANKISLIHANSLRMVLYSVLLQKITGMEFKIIYTKHNVTMLEEKYESLFIKLLNNHVDRIIAVSNFGRESLVSLGVNPAKIMTVYNGVDMQQFTFHNKETTEITKIGILARLSEEKNHELFLDIAYELRGVPDLSFYIAGEGPERNNIQNKIAALKMAGNVKLLGAVQNPEKFIKAMDILLFTSHREVFPMAILEGMAVGTPIISIDRGGIGEVVIDNKTGFLISNHCVDAFCEKILMIKSDEEKKRQMIEEARQKVERDFSLQEMVNKTLQEYVNCF